jgi:hypothetical protein
MRLPRRAEHSAMPNKFYLRASGCAQQAGQRRRGGHTDNRVAGLCLHKAENFAEGTLLPRHKKHVSSATQDLIIYRM